MNAAKFTTDPVIFFFFFCRYALRESQHIAAKGQMMGYPWLKPACSSEGMSCITRHTKKIKLFQHYSRHFPFVNNENFFCPLIILTTGTDRLPCHPEWTKASGFVTIRRQDSDHVCSMLCGSRRGCKHQTRRLCSITSAAEVKKAHERIQMD